MDRLTPGEEQVMLRLWKLKKATVKEIVELYHHPRPAYNTTSTIVRILEKKNFIIHEPFGKGFRYEPKVGMEEYRSFLLKNLLANYYGDNKSHLVSSIEEMRTMQSV